MNTKVAKRSNRTRRFFSLLLMPLLVACSQAQSAPAPTADGCRADQDPFACVRQRCGQAGGLFDDTRNACLCSAGGMFSAEGRGSCRVRPIWSECLKQPGGFLKTLRDQGEEAFNECLKIARIDQTDIFLTPAPGASDEASARWADAMAPVLVDAIRQQPVLRQELTIEWVMGPSSFDKLAPGRLADFLNPPRLLLQPPKESTPIHQTLYFPEGTSLEVAFETGAREEHVQLPEAPADEPLLRRTRVAVNEALARPFTVNQRTLFTEDGCAGYCELADSRATTQGPVSRVKKYAWGQLFSDTLYLWEDDTRDRAYAQIALLPSGDVSLIQTAEPVRTSEGGLSSRYRIFDSRFSKLLGEGRTRPFIPNRAAVLDRVARMSSGAEGAALPQAVVCESGFSASTLNALGTDLFLRGPLSSREADANRRRSVFGWVDSGRRAGDIDGIWGRYSASGLAALTEVGVRIPFDRYDEHAQKVAGIATGPDRSVKILPIGAEECSESGSKWIPQVLGHSKAKVVNWSAVNIYSAEACRQSEFANQIRANAHSLLYVVAAGNDGRNADRESISYCPQGLSGQGNLIVVASGWESGIAPLSNYGSRYADIVADGTHGDGGIQSNTTSMATPRVTRTAAMLAAEYPALSPAKLRKAILLSARIPERWGLAPLPVRSGGYLDDSAAREMAQRMNAHPEWNDEELLSRTHCYRVNPNCSAAKQRIRLFKSTGLIP